MPNITGANRYVDVPPVIPVVGGVMSVANVVAPDSHALLGAEYLTDACAEADNEWLDFCTVDNTIGQCVDPDVADPQITAVTPPTLPASAPPTLITVHGLNFQPGAVIEVGAVVHPTTFLNVTTLTTIYDPTVAGTVQFTVRNPNDEESNDWPFVVTAPAADPDGPDDNFFDEDLDNDGDVDVVHVYDVREHTIAEIQAYIEHHNNDEATQDVLDAELARGADARSTLIAWLQARLGGP